MFLFTNIEDIKSDTKLQFEQYRRKVGGMNGLIFVVRLNLGGISENYLENPPK